MQQIIANAMAAQLDKMFRFVVGASYANNGAPATAGAAPVTGATAIPAMSVVLANSTKTLTDLAEVVDGFYIFN